MSTEAILAALAAALLLSLTTNIVLAFLIRSLSSSLTYQQSIYSQNLLDATGRVLRSQEQAFRARESRLRRSGDPRLAQDSPAPPIAGVEEVLAARDPEKPYKPMADPDHPDRPFLG